MAKKTNPNPELDFECGRGSVEQAHCFRGFTAVLAGDDGNDIAIFAASVEALSRAWDRLTNMPIEKGMIERSVCFNARDVAFKS